MIDLLILAVLVGAASWALTERRRTRETGEAFPRPTWPSALPRRSSAAAPPGQGGAGIEAGVAPRAAPTPESGPPSVSWPGPPPGPEAAAPAAPLGPSAAGTVVAALRRALLDLSGVAIPRPQVPAVPWLGALARPGGAAVALSVALLFTWMGQQSMASPETSSAAVTLYFVGLALFVVLEWTVWRRHAAASGEDERTAEVPVAALDALAARTADASGAAQTRRPARRTAARRLLLGAAIVLCAVVWIQMRGRPPTADYGSVVALWLLSMAAGLGAALLWGGASWGARGERQEARGWRRPSPVWVLVGTIVVAAVALRVVALDRYPYVFGGDEGSQAMSAVAVIEGKLKNPFGTGWYSVPTLFFFLQAGTILAFGDSVIGARMAAALIGASAVFFTFLLARRLAGTPVAILAAAMLAAFHYHVHFSRLSSNQVADSLAIVAVLYFLDRLLLERRPADALAAGLAIGLSQYFSFAGRIIPFIALAYIVLFLVRNRLRSGWTVPTGPPAFRRSLIAWIVLGSLLAYMPHWAFYQDNPGEFNSRVNQVSMFASGWLEREIQSTGKGAPELVLNQLRRAALLPFFTQPGGWYVNHRPFTGVPMALFIGIGLAIATLGFWRREYLGITIAYWACAVGLGLTEDPTQTQRFVVAAPFMALFVAVAVVTIARAARDLARLPQATVGVFLGALVFGLLAWNVNHYFLVPREHRLYGDGNSLTATEMGYYLRAKSPGPTVYFLGPGRMFYYGFQSVPFIARTAKGIDVERPLTPSSPPLPLSGPTIFIALPEREPELAFVRTWYPNGETLQARVEPGGHLFTAYEVRSP